MLSARDVEQAIEARILGRTYPLGTPLPPVRRLAAELGTSPSTVGRALQGLERRGWIDVATRRGATVVRRLPSSEDRAREVASNLTRLAVRWRLAGQGRQSFEALVRRVGDEVYAPEPRVVFLECNPTDLDQMAAQVQLATSSPVQPLLLDEAAGRPDILRGALVLTPFFHLAEARDATPEDAEVVPLNFAPSEETLLALTALPKEARILVIGANERSRRRLEGLVHQYSPGTVRGVEVDNADLGRLAEEADAVVTTNAAEVPKDVLRRAGRVVWVSFVLESDRLDPASVRYRRQPGPALSGSAIAGHGFDA